MSNNRFLSLLQRLRTSGPREKDLPVIKVIGPTIRKRAEEPVDRKEYTMAAVMTKILTSNSYVHDPKDGLLQLGWKEIPDNGQPEIESGNFGSIRLAYNFHESSVPLERRHIAAAKIQSFNSPDEMFAVHNEVSVLRSCIHENIVYMYGCFAVKPSSGEPKRSFWMLMEYANAGDMLKECSRYPHSCIPESGAKFYSHQICDGVKYLHSKEISHNDLHVRNVLLKYNRDGTKTCMITDFGLAEILQIPDPDYRDISTMTRFQMDVGGICWIISAMIGERDVPKEAKPICDIGREMLNVISYRWDPKCPCTVDGLLKFKWFKTRGYPPIPRSPTHMLPDQIPEQIGYLPQEHPTAAPVDLKRESRTSAFVRRAKASFDNIRDRLVRRTRTTSRSSDEPGPSRNDPETMAMKDMGGAAASGASTADRSSSSDEGGRKDKGQRERAHRSGFWH